MMASFDGYAYSKVTENQLLPNVFQSPDPSNKTVTLSKEDSLYGVAFIMGATARNRIFRMWLH